jgi:hypothetical protein
MRTALLTCLAIATAGAQPQTGRIEGIVRDAASHQPVKKASVSIQPGTNQTTPLAFTDASGAFLFDNLPAGQYQLTIEHRNYPQTRMGGVRRTVQVSANDTTPSVTVELVPGASVSGHIVDEDGDPMTGCVVEPHPARKLKSGIPMMGVPMSGEDGSYRLSGVPPGNYIITGQCSQSVFQPRPLSEGPDPPPAAAYPTLFYPGASNAKSAQVVTLTAGAEKSGVDFQMRPVPVTLIHGKVIAGSGDWRGRKDLRVELIPIDPSGPGWFGFPGGEIDPKDGTFELSSVFPGSYRLVAYSQDFSVRGQQTGASDQVGAVMRVDVTDKPMELSLPLHRAFDISGTVEIERGNDTANPVTPGQINFQLRSETQFGGAPAPTLINEDGSFTIKSVLPGEWRIQLFGPSVFVKSVRLGSEEVTNRLLDLTSGTAAPLRIVVSANMATIKGTAPVGQIVFAATLDGATLDKDDPTAGQRAAEVDSSGHFDLPSLPPGKYRVIAGDVDGNMPEEGGQEVSVGEGETVMIELKP